MEPEPLVEEPIEEFVSPLDPTQVEAVQASSLQLLNSSSWTLFFTDKKSAIDVHLHAAGHDQTYLKVSGLEVKNVCLAVLSDLLRRLDLKYLCEILLFPFLISFS